MPTAHFIIFHNPACSTSRKVLAALRAAGREPEVVEYLKVGWTNGRLEALAAEVDGGLKSLLRRKESLTRELGLIGDVSDRTLLDAMIAHPVLVERPIVSGPAGVVLCRPPERLAALL